MSSEKSPVELGQSRYAKEWIRAAHKTGKCLEVQIKCG